MARGDTENTLEWVQADFALVISYEYLSQVVYVLCFLLRPHNEVVETNQHVVNEVMEAGCHGMLEGGSSVFQAKGHDSICECAQRGCECSLLMIFFLDLNLVIFEKSGYEGKYSMFGACIDNLIDEGY